MTYDKEWISLIKQARDNGISTTDVRQELSNQSTGTKFIYEQDDSGRVVNRVLEVSGIDDLTVVSMAVANFRKYYTNQRWDQSDDEEIQEMFNKIVAVDDVLNGTIRPEKPNYRKVGGS